MSGSFERLRYDEDAYQIDLRQSTAPLTWTLDPNRNQNCQTCRPGDPSYRGTQGDSISATTSLIDAESDLTLRNYPASRDPARKYLPYCPDCSCSKTGYPCGGGMTCPSCQPKRIDFPVCPNWTDYTRLSVPICTSRGVGINRFQPLCLNPQDETRWLVQGDVGISSRNLFKDNHVPCIPRPLEVEPLPNKPLPCVTTQAVCGNNIQPMNPFYYALKHEGCLKTCHQNR